MNDEAFISILIAEDNEVSREMMAGILRARGFKVYGAIDGESAIKVTQERSLDLAIVDINMMPQGGFHFCRYLVAKGIKLPVIIVTGDDSADMLTESSSLGVAQVIQKPVEPKRLIQAVERILRHKGLNPAPLAIEPHESKMTPDQIMAEVLRMAEDNVRTKKGGPYAAIVAQHDGEIWGRGTGGQTPRVDPIAHAEVMAIRKAAEKMGTENLSGLILYCSSEPTRVGQAVILSVGIETVYYGLSHSDIGEIKAPKATQAPQYIQMKKDDALAMFKAAQKL